MKNAQYWNEYLERIAEGQKNGSIKPKQAAEIKKTAKLAISLTKLQLDYQRMKQTLGEKAVVIPMLESSENAS